MVWLVTAFRIVLRNDFQHSQNGFRPIFTQRIQKSGLEEPKINISVAYLALNAHNYLYSNPNMFGGFTDILGKLLPVNASEFVYFCFPEIAFTSTTIIHHNSTFLQPCTEHIWQKKSRMFGNFHPILMKFGMQVNFGRIHLK